MTSDWTIRVPKAILETSSGTDPGASFNRMLVPAIVAALLVLFLFQGRL